MLLDEHIGRAVALGLRRRRPQVPVQTLADWEVGSYLGQSDEAILEWAAKGGWTLVTYDCRTIPPLLQRWAEQGRGHAGIVLVDEKTIPQPACRALAAALAALFDETARWAWTDRVVYLSRR